MSALGVSSSGRRIATSFDRTVAVTGRSSSLKRGTLYAIEPFLILVGPMITAAGLLGGHTHFLHWGVIQISLANLIVIVVMLVVFALAVLIPMPHSGDEVDSTQETPDAHHD